MHPKNIFLPLGVCLVFASLSAAHAQVTETVAPQAAPAEAAPAAPTANSNAAAAIDNVMTRLPANQEERDQMAARSQALDAEAKQRDAEAARVYEAAKTECWKKFLVSDCLEEARQAYRKENNLSKRQAREASGLDRQVRKYDAAQRAATREAENAKRDAEMEAKAEAYRKKQAGAAK